MPRPRKRKPGRPRQHGGRRANAGRKPLDGVGVVFLGVKVKQAHIEKVERWQDARGLDTVSEAVRQIIDEAPGP